MQTEKSVFREYLEAFLIAVIFATFARTYVVQAFKIPSGSMEQNLLIGDHILVNKFAYGPTVSALERHLLPARSVHRGVAADVCQAQLTSSPDLPHAPVDPLSVAGGFAQIQARLGAQISPASTPTD